MKLLITTQIVDETDPVLGFFCSWITEFAQQVESLEVICLKEGTHTFPTNVTVHSLGKEKGNRSRFVYASRFLVHAWRLRSRYDAVFMHMNPEYAVLAGPLWKMLGKRLVLWYLHKAISLRLRIATFFADAVCTATPLSLRLRTGKKRVVGHGLDTRALPFMPPPPPPLTFLTVGRISPVKRTDLIIRAFARSHGADARLVIVGSATSRRERAYRSALETIVQEENIESLVEFRGAVPHENLPEVFATAHLFLHASDTGSLDKAVLEPLATGMPVLTTNQELADAMSMEGVVYAPPDVEKYAAILTHLVMQRPWEDLRVRSSLRQYVIEHHELSRLIGTLTAILNEPRI